MACILLDSTDPAAVIAAAKLRVKWRNMEVRAAAGYKTGSFAWPESARTQLRGMGLKVVNISTAPGVSAEIYDVEDTDWTPAEVAAQAAADARNNSWPVLYVNRSNKATTISDLAAEGLGPGLPAGRGFGLIVATLDGTFKDIDGSDLRTQAGVVAVQYAQADSPVHVSGQPPDLDVSVVTAAGEQWLGVASATDTAVAMLSQAATDIQAAVKLLQAGA